MDENNVFPPPNSPRRARLRRGPATEPAAVEPPDEEAQAEYIAPATAPLGETRRARARKAQNAGSFSPWKSLQSVFGVALLVATLFTMWTPANLFSNNMMERMFQAMEPRVQAVDLPTSTPSPKPRIGLVAGHWAGTDAKADSIKDTGAVCPDGLSEVSVNLKIATMVQEILTREGYEVDLLAEFDRRLSEYQALALVSIHNDSCDFINDQATGYKVAAAPSTIFPEKAMRLTSCLSERYRTVTGMSFHYNTVTRDMTEYHAFNEIHSNTPAAIIETGFLNLDRDILTNKTEMVAQGVASGILCFVRNENVSPEIPPAGTP